ncbi:MAG: thiamine phosphate synthase [Lachnospiraceae bacterium]|nr:thiamine phosphate synthase [Lachnospiraceae bacterium]
MKVDRKSMILYAVTDRAWLGDNGLETQVEAAIKGGCTFIQLREKYLKYNDFLESAKKIKVVTDRYQIPFVINDNVEIAASVDADGVHIGQEDEKLANARSVLGPNKIIGVSVHNLEEAMKAEEGGANYIGVGSVFSTTTKKDIKRLTPDTLKEISNTVNIPVVAIGGITKDNILQLSGSGVDGVAVISALFAKTDITEAARKLYILSNIMVQSERNGFI